jgi:hypothetical protein
VPGKAVGNHPAHQQQDNLRDHARSEDEPQRGGGVGQLEDGERERDGRHGVAEEVNAATAEEEREVPFVEESEGGSHAISLGYPAEPGIGRSRRTPPIP